MTPTPYYLDRLYLSTKSDWDAFARWTDFLPRRAEADPYHSGPHSLQRFRMVFELIRPSSVFEVGFNLGHSAVLWLELGVLKVRSIDIRDDAKVREAAAAILNRYQSRFQFSINRSLDFASLDRAPDLISIDGSHEAEEVCHDIDLGLRLCCPFFLMDDYDSIHGPGVVAAVADRGLIPLAIFGTMALCAPPDRYTQRSDPLGSNYYG